MTLTLSAASSPTEMYVTDTAGCSDGGSWEAYGTSKAWTLGQTNATATVYVKYRNAGLFESACVNDTIIHDNIAPTSPTISIAAAAAYATSTSVTLTLSASASPSQMYVSNTAGCSAGGSWETYGTSKAWTLGQTNATATVYVKYRDTATNETTCENDTIIHDNIAPTSPTISIAAGATYATSTSVTLTLSAASSPSEMYVTNTAGCSAGGSWQAYGTSKAWTLGQTNATVYVKYRDAATNESTCANDTIIHDNIAPTVAITAPASMSYVNAASASAFTVSGTCSEAGQTVSISGSGTASTSCSGGNTFSVAVDLSLPAQGNVSLSADHSDAATNAATTSSRTFVKYTVAPTMSVNDPASVIYSGDYTSFPISGACTGGADASHIDFVATVSAAPYVFANAVIQCSSATFAGNADFTSVPDGALSVTASNTDPAGNAGISAGRSFTKDVTPPELVITAPSVDIDYTNETNYPVSGTCVGMEDARTVTLKRGATALASPTCSSGAWSATGLNFVSLPNGALTFTADGSDANGNVATQASRNFNKLDNTPAVVTETNPSDTTAMPVTWMMRVAGTCTNNGKAVQIRDASNSVLATGTCGSNVYDIYYNSSALSTGTQTPTSRT